MDLPEREKLIELGFKVTSRFDITPDFRAWCGQCGAEVTSMERWEWWDRVDNHLRHALYREERWLLRPCGCLVDPDRHNFEGEGFTFWMKRQEICGPRELVP